MPRLHRILNMPEYTWKIPGYAWLCLNIPKTVWMVFTLYLAIVIPHLNEQYTVFLENKNFSIIIKKI